jgi:hypothetical protein
LESGSRFWSPSEAPQIAIGAGRFAAIWGERFSNGLGYASTWFGAGWPASTFLNTGTRPVFQWPGIAVDGAGTAHIAFAAGDVVY